MYFDQLIKVSLKKFDYVLMFEHVLAQTQLTIPIRIN